MKTLDKYLQAKSKLAQAKEELDTLQQILMDEMHKENLLSVKTPQGTVSLAKRVTKQVDPLLFSKWVEEQPDMERDMFFTETLDKTKAVALADKILKDDGEIVPYITGVTETEYISVRAK